MRARRTLTPAQTLCRVLRVAPGVSLSARPPPGAQVPRACPVLQGCVSHIPHSPSFTADMTELLMESIWQSYPFSSSSGSRFAGR